MSVRFVPMAGEPIDNSTPQPWIMVPLNRERRLRLQGHFDVIESTRPAIAAVRTEGGLLVVSGLRPGRARIRALDRTRPVGELQVTVKARREIAVRFYSLSDARRASRRNSQQLRTMLANTNEILGPQTNIEVVSTGRTYQLAGYDVAGSTDPGSPGSVEGVDLGTVVTREKIRLLAESIVLRQRDASIFAHVFLVWEYERHATSGRRRDRFEADSFTATEQGLCSVGRSCFQTFWIVLEDRSHSITLAHELGHCLTNSSPALYGPEGHSSDPADLMYSASTRRRIRQVEADLMNPSGAHDG